MKFRCRNLFPGSALLKNICAVEYIIDFTDCFFNKIILENPLTLRQTTRDIIKLVETKSGIPVRVTEDPTLPTIATVRMARKGSVQAHLIIYKPNPLAGNRSPSLILNYSKFSNSCPFLQFP